MFREIYKRPKIGEVAERPFDGIEDTAKELSGRMNIGLTGFLSCMTKTAQCVSKVGEP